eukprot:scaffold16576_cov97-Skeletonema_dohrnii-CCMP3373.AAC.3
MIDVDVHTYVDSSLQAPTVEHRPFDYAIGQQAWKNLYKPNNKLGQRSTATGPHNVIQVHTNGTLTFQLRPGDTEPSYPSCILFNKRVVASHRREGWCRQGNYSIMDLGLLHSAILDYSEAARLN